MILKQKVTQDSKESNNILIIEQLKDMFDKEEYEKRKEE